MFRIGSLFSGSGGFELAATICGGIPVWASEIEPYPIAVTKSRFPNMKHLGSVTDVKGNEVEPVDVITFGSPCQDLSVAGKRAGLKHEDNGDEETTRSGLFMEAVRIIKEMREATNGVYPRFAIWENVPGAFSSNKGEDFRTVCEELIKIVEPGATMPAVPKNGWPYADCYCGDGWSLAYRVYDAQYWGVPQRRRRIYLVADFGGECAGQISFERDGLRGYFAESGAPGQRIAGSAKNCPGAYDRDGEGNCLTPWDVQSRRIFTVDGPWPSLYGGEGGGHGYACVPVKSYDIGEARLRTPGEYDECSPTLTARCGTGGNNVPAVVYPVSGQYLFENHSQDTRYKGPLDVCPIVSATFGMGGNNQPFVVECQPTVYNGENITSPLNKVNPQPGDPCHTLGTDSRNYVVFCIDGDKIGKAERTGGSGLGVREGDKMYTLTAKDAGKHAVCIRYIVRRLTPTECARLQGFADAWAVPDSKEDFTDEEYEFWCKVNLDYDRVFEKARPNEDGWYNVWREVKPSKAKGEDFEPYWEDTGKAYTHKTRDQMLKWYNKLHTDGSEYKLWGNGIALPTALYVMQGISDVLKGESINV